MEYKTGVVMPLRFAALAVLIVAPWALAAKGAPRAGRAFGKPIYWQNDDISFDTLGLKDLIAHILGNTEPKKLTFADLVAECKADGFVYKSRDASAITLAILHDLGYKVVLLSQWGTHPSGGIRVNAPGMTDGYESQRLISDYMWEVLERHVAEKPTRMRDDWAIKLHFVGAGASEYAGKEIVRRTMKQLVGSHELVLEFDEGGGQDQLIKRHVYEVFVFGDKKKKLSALVSRIEAKMDETKLDMSYKPPTFLPVD